MHKLHTRPSIWTTRRGTTTSSVAAACAKERTGAETQNKKPTRERLLWEIETCHSECGTPWITDPERTKEVTNLEVKWIDLVTDKRKGKTKPYKHTREQTNRDKHNKAPLKAHETAALGRRNKTSPGVPSAMIAIQRSAEAETRELWWKLTKKWRLLR